jgi:hypothetical protein
MKLMQDLQRLRLLWAAYAANQPDEKRKLGMAQALYRYTEAVRMRGNTSGSAIEPIHPIERIEKV